MDGKSSRAPWRQQGIRLRERQRWNRKLVLTVDTQRNLVPRATSNDENPTSGSGDPKAPPAKKITEVPFERLARAHCQKDAMLLILQPIQNSSNRLSNCGQSSISNLP